MRKRLYLALFFTSLFVCLFFSASNRDKSNVWPDFQVELLPDTVLFILKEGDIIARPNWGWLPGSYWVQNGRKFGHSAIVTKGASGKTMEEALSKASIVEALFFDQATRKFHFNKNDQIRETNGLISFGEKFTGIRYRLRMKLTVDQTETMKKFLRNQLDGGYNLLSLKMNFEENQAKNQALLQIKNANWQCAALVWESFYLATGVDIDANGGLLVYPDDIVASKYFDLPDGRIRF